MQEIVLVGAGDHAKAIIATARKCDLTVRAIYSDDPSSWGQTLAGVPITGPVSRAESAGLPGVISCDDPRKREEIAGNVPLRWVTLVHPSVILSPSTRIGLGTILFEGVVVQAGVAIGSHVVAEANATISHDCVVEDFAHLGPGVDLAGNVHVGKGANLAIGAVVIPNVRVGAWSMIEPQAVVIRDVADRACESGVLVRAAEPPPAPSTSAFLLNTQRTLLTWVALGAAVMVLGYGVGRLGLFLRQVAATQQVEMHSLALSLWFGLLLIALGVIVNLSVLYQQSRLTHQFSPQGALGRGRISYVSVISIALTILGIAMAAYLLDPRHFPG